MPPPGDIIEQIRAAIAAEGSVRLALLFGSRATGRARPESDVDLAVEGVDVDEAALAGFRGR